MPKTKRTVKDSVFTKLFGEKEYAFELYKSFHPEDTTSTQDDLEIITLENVLVNGAYNDLGLLMNNRLMLFIEAQSTWNENMPIRILLYIAKTYERYIHDRQIDIHRVSNVRLPKPEAYVVYTGERKKKPREMKLSDHYFEADSNFFKSKNNSLELNVKMIYNCGEGTIVNQYIDFCRIFDEQRKLYDEDADRAVYETLRICMERNILSDYLKRNESEVNRLMKDFIWDQKLLMKIHINSEKQIAREEARAEGLAEGLAEGREQGLAEGRFETAKMLFIKGISPEIIAECTSLTLSEVQALSELTTAESQ